MNRLYTLYWRGFDEALEKRASYTRMSIAAIVRKINNIMSTLPRTGQPKVRMIGPQKHTHLTAREFIERRLRKQFGGSRPAPWLVENAANKFNNELVKFLEYTAQPAVIKNPREWGMLQEFVIKLESLLKDPKFM